jgi:hypothetical protein
MARTPLAAFFNRPILLVRKGREQHQTHGAAPYKPANRVVVLLLYLVEISEVNELRLSVGIVYSVIVGDDDGVSIGKDG